MTEPLRDGPSPTRRRPMTSAATDDDRATPTRTRPGPGLPPPTAIESLVNALLEAGPEVAEHVVRAAQELLLAAQAIVDAADKAVAGAASRPQRATGERRTTTPDPATQPATVRHLDLAE